MLRRKPTRRIVASDLLGHEWLQEEAAEEEDDAALNQTMAEKIKGYNAQHHAQFDTKDLKRGSDVGSAKMSMADSEWQTDDAPVDRLLTQFEAESRT